MVLGEKVDLGNIHIHKKVIGDIAVEALNEIPGVSVARFGFLGDFFDLFGYKNFPGVYVNIDQSAQISIELRVQIEYGHSISLTALQIQDKILAAVERSLDVQLKEINVSVQSVVRRSAKAA